MSFIDHATREINFKIVYYGPGLGGKTTNLQYIYNKTRPELKSKMISLATETERSLFCSILASSLELRGLVELDELLGYPGVPRFEAVAATGVGVFDTLKEVAKRMIVALKTTA